MPSFAPPAVDDIESESQFTPPGADEIVPDESPSPFKKAKPFTGTITLSPSEQSLLQTGSPDPSRASFEDYQKTHPTERDAFISRMMPQIQTPEQQGQMGRYLKSELAPELETPGTLGQAWEAAWQGPLPKGEHLLQGQPTSTGGKIALGTENAAEDLASTFLSPAGIATLGIAGLPKLAQRAVALGFSAQMASQLPEQASALLQEISKPAEQRDWKKIAYMATSGTAGAILATLGAAHGLESGTPTIEKVKTDATSTRIKPESRQPEYIGTEAQRLPAEAGGGDSAGGEAPKPEAQPPQGQPAPGAQLGEIPAQDDAGKIAKISQIAALEPAKFVEQMKSVEGGLTSEAWRMGLAADSPEYVARLKAEQEAATARSKALKSSNIGDAFAEANRSQFFREAYEAATGTGSAGFSLRKTDPSYKPPFPPEEAAKPPSPEQAQATSLPQKPATPTGATIPPAGELSTVPGTSKTEAPVEAGASSDASKVNLNSLQRAKGKYDTAIKLQDGRVVKSSDLFTQKEIENSGPEFNAIMHNELERLAIEKKALTPKELLRAKRGFVSKSDGSFNTLLEVSRKEMPSPDIHGGPPSALTPDQRAKIAEASVGNLKWPKPVSDHTDAPLDIQSIAKKLGIRNPIKTVTGSGQMSSIAETKFGRKIYLHDWTIEQFRNGRISEGELAFILAHEHEHLTQGHKPDVKNHEIAASVGAVKRIIESGYSKDDAIAILQRAEQLKELAGKEKAIEIDNSTKSKDAHDYNAAVVAIRSAFKSGKSGQVPPVEPPAPAAAKAEGQTLPPEPTVETTPLDPATGMPIPPKPIVGMGGAVPNEFSGGAGADVYGIAQRVRDQRAAAGQVAEVVPGKGINPPDSINRGRELLAADPRAAEKAVLTFERDPNNAVSADGIAVARAKGEELARSARNIEEKFGTDSPEYRMAWQALSDWDARTKPMQTEWHKIGQAQQGETDIDTGTFTGLQRAYKQDTGKEFTPRQATTARKFADRSVVADTKAGTAQQKLYEQLDLELGNVDVPVPKNLDEARLLFSKFNKGDEFTPQQVKTLWRAAKKFYLDRGVTNFDDIRNGLATDMGLPVKDVTRGLAQPKGVRVLTDEMWKRQQEARRVDQQAKRWLKDTTMPGYLRAIQTVPRVLFGLKVGFHGTVALGTHAPTVAFQPPFWATYIRDFGKMYRMVGSRAYYEQQVQDLLRRPNYTTARRAGLVNDPFQYEDFNSPKVAQYIGGLSGMGNRGYSVLKLLRQDMFDQHWGNLPETARIPEVAKALADGINHATGVVKVQAPKGAAIVAFAPRLEMSRAAWLVTDPIRAANTFLQWSGATEGEKTFAVHQVKEKAWVAGTLLSLLALNQGMLTATKSDQKVNMTDPMKSDFLKFKIAGMDFSYGNAMLSMARLPVRLYHIRSSDGGKLKSLIYPDEDSYSVLGSYARSQLSPFASLVSTLWLKGDWENRPLPNSQRPMPKRLRAQGVKPYTWTEFWTEQVLPIPAEEAARDVWKHGLGMSSEQMKAARKALATISIMGATGGRLTDDRRTTQPANPLQE